jgi:hypothetical protein
MASASSTQLTPQARLDLLGEILAAGILRRIADRRRLPTLQENSVDSFGASAPDRGDSEETR